MVLGGIAGNLIGLGRSREAEPPKDPESVRFFDSLSAFSAPSVLLLSGLQTIANNGKTFEANLLIAMRTYPKIEYGTVLRKWSEKQEKIDRDDINAAMIGIPYGWMHDDPNDAATEASEACQTMFVHVNSVKAASYVAGAIAALRSGGKKALRKWLTNYTDLHIKVNIAQPKVRRSDRTCAVLPYAFAAFMKGTYFEESMMAGAILHVQPQVTISIIGALSEACYEGGVPKWMQEECRQRIETWLYRDITKFLQKFSVPHDESLTSKSPKLIASSNRSQAAKESSRVSLEVPLRVPGIRQSLELFSRKSVDAGGPEREDLNNKQRVPASSFRKSLKMDGTLRSGDKKYKHPLNLFRKSRAGKGDDSDPHGTTDKSAMSPRKKVGGGKLLNDDDEIKPTGKFVGALSFRRTSSVFDKSRAKA